MIPLLASPQVAVQEEIAQEISDTLRLKLTGEEQKRLSKRYTDNTEAYQLYLKGRYYFDQRTTDGIRRSTEYFQEAIKKDPKYVWHTPAWPTPTFQAIRRCHLEKT